MIISNSSRFIYIHISKCGGTSVSGFLERRLGPQDISLNLSPHAGWADYLAAVKQRHGLDKHSTAVEIARAMGRNPFARAYSIFTFTKRADARNRPDSQRYADIKDMSFEEFLDSSYIRKRRIFASRLQSDWVRNSPVSVRSFKLENVDAVMANLARRFYGEAPETLEVPRKNFSTGQGDWQAMSEDAERLVLSLYEEDFETFGYPHRIPRPSRAV